MAAESICGSEAWQDRVNVVKDKVAFLAQATMPVDGARHDSDSGFHWILREIHEELHAILEADEKAQGV